MKKLLILIMLLFVITFQTGAVTIKLGSLAPVGSPWDITLNKIASDWREISGGRVILKIYSGGIAGSEEDMIGKIRIGQLDAAALTTIGLNRISPDLLTLCLPLLYKNSEEVLYVLDKMKSEFELIVEDKGFKMIGWSLSGWIKFFSRNPVVFPEDLQKQKFAVTKGDAILLQAWKELGFNALPIDSLDLMTSLSSGMVDSFYAPPVAAAAYQWFGIAKNMCSLPVSPLITGFVIGERSWKKIPANLKDDLVNALNEALSPLSDAVDDLDVSAMEVMLDNGLTVNNISQDAETAWRLLINQGYDDIIGKAISPDIYLEAKNHLTDFRDANGN